MKFKHLYRFFTFLGYQKIVNFSYLSSMLSIIGPETLFRSFKLHIKGTFIDSSTNEKIHKETTIYSAEDEVLNAGKYGAIVYFPSVKLTYKFLLDSRAKMRPSIFVNSKNFNIFKALNVEQADGLELDDFVIYLYINDEIYDTTPIVTLDKRNCFIKKYL